MKLLFFIFLLGMAVSSSFANGLANSKAETIQTLFKDECNKTVSYQSALAMVRPLFLSCVPGTTVALEKSCELKCLKASKNTLVGR